MKRFVTFLLVIVAVSSIAVTASAKVHGGEVVMGGQVEKK